MKTVNLFFIFKGTNELLALKTSTLEFLIGTIRKLVLAVQLKLDEMQTNGKSWAPPHHPSSRLIPCVNQTAWILYFTFTSYFFCEQIYRTVSFNLFLFVNILASYWTSNRWTWEVKWSFNIKCHAFFSACIAFQNTLHLTNCKKPDGLSKFSSSNISVITLRGSRAVCLRLRLNRATA